MIRIALSVVWLAWMGAFKLAWTAWYALLGVIVWGLSRVTGDPHSRISIRRDGPEILKEAWSVHCDSWARTAFETVTGRAPWLIHDHEPEGRTRSCSECGHRRRHAHRGPT